ncbi:NUDIX hydrolase [Xylanimonas cellulosilytica DSM 15894]|uniref:NUDIX hydrolase n=1 Tax=Xylanimonas cellulosilytica (strain DSM 15894 / JCM 12276 / CECT 5975 / KCTC 9989 / LMG 20990 / NBRC 107835 / XIL07) TaxID=446471 RepID=D1BRG5_XYLCX|nr:NUDIX hydrolase [Xylanimonas cellulosilytica DSM 15894]
MPSESAGLLLYRRNAGGDVEVLLGHMGGPFWSRKHEGAWTLPKGELEPGESAHAAALREGTEELGVPVPGPVQAGAADVDLGEIRQRAGKRVRAWARQIAPDALDLPTLRSNTVTIEWPPRTGRRLEVPELDRYAWFSLAAAREVVVQAQSELIDRLEEHLRAVPSSSCDGEPVGRTIYDAMGGMPAVAALARAWHARVLDDPVVAHAFERRMHPQHDERLAAYWAEQLGGPATFTASMASHASVVAVHSGNGPHEEMDARAVACFELALDDAAIPDDDRLRNTLTLWFAWAMQVLNHEHETPEEVPVDLPMPTWTWDGPARSG